jgi:hypothetical protein
MRPKAVIAPGVRETRRSSVRAKWPSTEAGPGRVRRGQLATSANEVEAHRPREAAFRRVTGREGRQRRSRWRGEGAGSDVETSVVGAVAPVQAMARTFPSARNGPGGSSRIHRRDRFEPSGATSQTCSFRPLRARQRTRSGRRATRHRSPGLAFVSASAGRRRRTINLQHRSRSRWARSSFRQARCSATWRVTLVARHGLDRVWRRGGRLATAGEGREGRAGRLISDKRIWIFPQRVSLRP